MIQLRNYQEEFRQRVNDAWARVRSVLGVMPTGAGKTATFSRIVHDNRGPSCVVVHRKEILQQISVALAKEEVLHRVIAPPATVAMVRRRHLRDFGKSYIDPQAPCGVASVQTLTSKAALKLPALRQWVGGVTLAVFDEGHHYVEAGIWSKAVHLFDRAKLLFVTATPERADGTGLGKGEGGFAEEMVEGPTVAYLQERGYLCKYKYYCPSTDFNVADLAVGKTGDFNAAALRARALESHIVGDMVSQYQQFAAGTQAIVFVTDVETANATAEAFTLAGVPAVALSAKTEDAERERELGRFERDDVRVLVNVDLFDEGFDVPAATTCIMGRPTMSLAKYMQMVGRVLRPAEGKEHAIIIDPVRNWERGHGQVNWPRVWSLAGRERGEQAGEKLTPQRVCLGCSQPYEAYYKACPYCGTVPEPAERSRPEQVDGDLTALDVDALQALFDARARANMDDDEFQRQQVARRVPPIGRRPELARFKAAKYRRGVLVNLIGWWVGMQGGRDPVEVQKRFFLRFGVDMLTAEALNLRETDELIERIARQFSEDLVA